jgi:hypothetical protein
MKMKVRGSQNPHISFNGHDGGPWISVRSWFTTVDYIVIDRNPRRRREERSRDRRPARR